MSFLIPAFLIGSLAAAIPILLHLLRRDVAPEVPFSAVHMLQSSPIERSKRRRLRDLLLLAARVAALVLLATAFARPYRAGTAPSSRVVIVAIDRSFSMGAPGVMPRAQQLASAALDDAGDARVAVIAFDERADVIALPGDRAQARRAIAQVTPGFGATAYAPVVARAAELAGGDPGALILITDLQRGGWQGDPKVLVPGTLEVDVKDVGAPASNAAVLQARVQPGIVVVSIRNSAAAPYSGRLRLSIDGREVASTSVVAPPETTLEVPVRHQAPSSGVLSASIDDDAGFPADNTRILLLDEPARPKVLFVVGAAAGVSGSTAAMPAFYVRRALEAAEDEAAFEATTMDGAAFTGLDPQAVRQYSAVALLSTRGLDRRSRETLKSFVRGGGGVFIAAGPDVDPSLLANVLGPDAVRLEVDEQSRPRVLAATDLRHPVFRPFGPLTANLGQVRFDRAWRISPEGWRVAAAFTDGAPALLERVEGSGRVLLFASDLDRKWNDLPLHPAFVPFLLETARYAAGEKGSRRNLPIGEAPTGAPPSPGVHSLPDGRRVVLNVDTRESELSRVSATEFADMLERAGPSPTGTAGLRAQQIEERQGYWQYGLVLMLLALVAESIVGRAPSP